MKSTVNTAAKLKPIPGIYKWAMNEKIYLLLGNGQGVVLSGEEQPCRFVDGFPHYSDKDWILAEESVTLSN